jgi:glycosyltransferase involved in cell wall biosynthesis
MKVRSASVLICTYNRAALLRETLAALQAMHPPENCEVEIIVIDNNSSDNTPRVVADAARRSPFPLITVHERAQGKSFALNRGLKVARGDIIALTDDDVWPDANWLRGIVERFRAGDFMFVFGKVLPKWAAPPPPELLTDEAQEIWGPLALLDYGDAVREYTPETQRRLPIGANLAFAREAVVRVGGWRTDLGKVDNTLISGEDHEIFCRLRRFNLYAGCYDPEIVVRHFVPTRRVTRAYFREWFFWNGRTHALMLETVYPYVDLNRVIRIGGVPRFFWRQAFEQFGRYLRTRLPGTPALPAFIEELKLIRCFGLVAECWKQQRRKTAGRPRSYAIQDGPNELARMA